MKSEYTLVNLVETAKTYVQSQHANFINYLTQIDNKVYELRSSYEWLDNFVIATLEMFGLNNLKFQHCYASDFTGLEQKVTDRAEKSRLYSSIIMSNDFVEEPLNSNDPIEYVDAAIGVLEWYNRNSQPEPYPQYVDKALQILKLNSRRSIKPFLKSDGPKSWRSWAEKQTAHIE